jgi:hypothetical protein
MDGACIADGEVRCMYRVLVGKPEGMRPLGRPKCRWEDNTMMDLQEVGFVGMGWLRWFRRALVNAVTNVRVP